jgi:hypothetical protein
LDEEHHKQRFAMNARELATGVGQRWGNRTHRHHTNG